MQRSTIVFIALFAVCGTVACGTIEVPGTEPGGIGNEAPGPTIASLTPERGPLGGGNEITLTGTGFVAGTSVVIAGIATADLTIESETTIKVVVPPGSEAEIPFDVLVFGPDGFSQLSEAYTYNTEPTLEAISKAFGPLSGGQTIEVFGDFLQTNNPGTPTVKVGEVEATGVEVIDDATIRFTTPEGVGDDVALGQDVTIETANGIATLDAAYTYLRPGLLLGTQQATASTENGIYFFDVPTTRLVKLVDLSVGIGRFFTQDDNTLLLRFNRLGGLGNREWGRLDMTTGTIEFLGQSTEADTGGIVQIRATTRVGLNLIGLANSQIGIFDPDTVTFSAIAGSSTSEFRGCLAAKSASEVFYLRTLAGSIDTIKINNGATESSFALDFNTTLAGALSNYRCHGASMVGANVIALFMNISGNDRSGHIVSINPSTGDATLITVLPGAFSELEPTPAIGFQ